MIEFDRVGKSYGGRTVVDGISFSIPEGETFVLLGRSGSGKTTALKMINRLVEPSTGTIRVFGKPIGEQPAEALRRRIGYVIQHVGLFPHYTVRENVAVVPRLLGWTEERIRERSDALLDQVGLPASRFGALRPGELSGGQQQRVGLARALACDPPVVLLDEPFGALDPVTRREMQGEFLRLSARLGKTMVLVTHDVREAVSFGHRICLVESGRIEQIGTPRELLFEPRSAFARAFFDPGRLSLELLSLSLADVLPYLPLTAPTGTEPVRVPATARLLDVLELPAMMAGAACVVEGPGGEALGATSGPLALDAYYVLRRERGGS